jgi:hypothetical protein
MPTPSHLAQLRGAIEDDRNDARASLARSWLFLENVKAYQRGEGPLPDELDFLQWREDLRLSLEQAEPQVPPGAAVKPDNPEPSGAGKS